MDRDFSVFVCRLDSSVDVCFYLLLSISKFQPFVFSIVLSLVIVTICDYKLRLDLSMVKQVADATDYYIDKRCKM